MLFSPKDSEPQGKRVFMPTGLPFTGSFDGLGQDKPFFPTLTKMFLIVGLGFLSWLATYTGMLELIIANAGSIDLSVRIAMGFAVAMLMLMIIYLLDSLFSPISWWLRIVYVCGYLFLTLISVGFGFGFYWKFLEARSESTRSAVSAVGQVQVALEGGQARLEQMQTTFDSLTTLSAAKAEKERTKGGTCPNSPPGDGPRRRLRDADAQNFSFASDFVRQRAGGVKKDIAALNGEMAKLSSGDQSTIDPTTGTRNIFLRGLNQKLDLTITRFNALRTDPQLKQFRDNFAARAQQSVFDNGRGGQFSCPDSQLQLALRGVVKAIDGLPDLNKPRIAAVEGSEAIVEAFRRLTTTLAGALVLQLPPTPQELRALQQKAVRSVSHSAGKDPTAGIYAGLGSHDFIPFFIAVFVDLCLLLVSINRPVNRMQKLMARAHEARDAQVHQILSRVHSVHEKGRSQRLDALHEVMFDSFGAQYVAVPLDVHRGTLDGAFGAEAQQDAYRKKVIEARYLATLMAALEGGGLASLAPAITQAKVVKKLGRVGSRFADSTSFRVYRFVSGAWPAIVLDDMLGASAQLDAEARERAAWELENRKMEGPSLNFGMRMPGFDPVQKPERADMDARFGVSSSVASERANDNKADVFTRPAPARPAQRSSIKPSPSPVQAPSPPAYDVAMEAEEVTEEKSLSLDDRSNGVSGGTENGASASGFILVDEDAEISRPVAAAQQPAAPDSAVLAEAPSVPVEDAAFLDHVEVDVQQTLPLQRQEDQADDGSSSVREFASAAQAPLNPVRDLQRGVSVVPEVPRKPLARGQEDQDAVLQEETGVATERVEFDFRSIANRFNPNG